MIPRIIPIITAIPREKEIKLTCRNNQKNDDYHEGSLGTLGLILMFRQR